MKKIIMLIAVCLVMLPVAANAEVDSNFTSSTQFLTNIGYSPDAGRILEVHTVDPYASIEKPPLTTAEKFWRVVSYVFPGEYDDWDYPGHRIVNDHTWFTDY